MARNTEVRYIQYYTAGSAAPKLEPPKPRTRRTTLPKPRPQQTYTIRLDPLALGGILISAIMLVLMVVGCVQLNHARQELAVMQKYVQTLREENTTLSDTYKQGYDLELVEDAAIGLGMIPVDQARHITISVEEPPMEQSITLWQRITGFMEGLFA